MRTIKFRAWLPNLSKMSYDVTLYANGWIESVTDDGGEWKHKPNDASLMQYTGLKDKNGVEIYEGDLCTDGDERSLIEIVWSANHNWGCLIIKGGVLSERLTFPLWQWDECRENRFRSLEVIGNIYENADLLK